ncbi:MAG: hypothetical protein GY754_33745 [bacterium]|nr:hypothetical protein [bacterium]
MKKLKPFIPGAVAVGAAILVCVFLIEETLVKLSCMAVGLMALSLAVVRSINTKHSRWRVLASTLIPAVLFIGIAWTHVPLRIAFRIYRSEFDRVASQIESGTPPLVPFRIGPFKIEMVGRRRDSGPPYLGSNQDEWEINGFVKHPDGHGFNLWSCIRLDDVWSYIAED